ncbi:hypothetical protein VC83_06940 [Pseudogymnoascus destructans]|uniref:Uncharacterized protein n=1 Tax=Pseudogymnoascus destructans TaxID=655981 RepID=A0A177A7C4_9PEZI|nr:uncharacterized protein VC83_06940 [Pseudogymnoascus destructans]OAF56924.1 hypothetical protein VC83_06940 [Pseudogymnoascus destructans]
MPWMIVYLYTPLHSLFDFCFKWFSSECVAPSFLVLSDRGKTRRICLSVRCKSAQDTNDDRLSLGFAIPPPRTIYSTSNTRFRRVKNEKRYQLRPSLREYSRKQGEPSTQLPFR